MFKKVLITFATLAVAMASAATTYKVKLVEPTMVSGTMLKAGDYKVEVTDTRAVFTAGKHTTEAKVKVETASEKFNATSFRYDKDTQGNLKLQEMKIGGSNMKLLFVD